MDELRAGLELATEEELRILTDMLFCRKFNPLDYICAPDPIDVQSQDRQAWLDTLEERFRFLAADGFTVLQGKTTQISYRQVLIQVCRYLKISYSQSCSTIDLEAEIFLCLLEQAWKRLPASRRKVLTEELQESFSQSQIAKQFPASVQHDPIRLVAEGGGALAVSSVIRPWIMRQLARQFALHAATYQTATQTLVKGGATVAMKVQTQATLQTAYRGMALSAARYSAARSIFAFLGSALWMWFLADLGWRAIATNYSRVIPVIFTLAQIRLTRIECWETA